MLVRPGDVAAGRCGAALRTASLPNVVAVIAYLAATFAPATKSDKGTREKLETQDYSRGARNCGGRNARYSGGSAESSDWSRRRRRLFSACRDTPSSPAATP